MKGELTKVFPRVTLRVCIAFSNGDKKQENATAKNIRIECSKSLLTSMDGSNCGCSLLFRVQVCVCVCVCVFIVFINSMPHYMVILHALHHN
jgi:hypothetical protein